MRAPDPLEWHPAYSHRTDLLDWLHGLGPFATMHVITVPFLKPMDWSPEVVSSAMVMTKAVLERRRVQGPAPYVGHPFAYTWMAGVDQTGRCVATDAWRMYDTSYPCRDADCGCGQGIDHEAAARATDRELADLLTLPGIGD